MKSYIIKRLLFVIPIMLILSFFTFSLTYLSPSDPAALYFESRGIHPEAGEIEAKREEMGLNDPLLVQYGRWLGNVLHGDLGTSYYYSSPVWQELTKRIPDADGSYGSDDHPSGSAAGYYNSSIPEWMDRLSTSFYILPGGFHAKLLGRYASYVWRWRKAAPASHNGQR